MEEVKIRLFEKIRTDLPNATSMIAKRLIGANLKARSPRQVPMLKNVHLKCRLQFAKKFIKEPNIVWHNVLWLVETKRKQFDTEPDKQYVRQPSKARRSSADAVGLIFME